MNAEEIFLNAVEIVDDLARRAYLDEVWREHPECRAEVEALLRSHLEAGSFLATPLVLPAADRFEGLSPAPLQPGTRIGPYLLQQLIGRGGMGVVYRAQQTEPVKRVVALKLIPQASSSSVINRFESERQALAIMDHPNIARVIDAGSTEAGQPWFVMELINGIPITEYCDRARMTPRQRLELMVPVCEAIQHAHQKGIIHRDIKPSNVLVAEYDSRPMPKVIDFGIAKAIGNPLTDKSVHTDFGSVVGTLEYMSPEQAGLNQLDIDTRSDIYSLGVLIYELLTGSTPINRKQLSEAAMLEVIRVIRDVEPQRPSLRISTTDGVPAIAANRNTEPARLSGLVRGELDWIAMKALEKDRSRRYQTANDLAEDLQRFLQDEPVSAGPPSRWYRIRKFVRRNRAMAASAGLLLAALIAGTVGTSVGMIRAQRAGNDKEIALDQVRLERDEKSRALLLVEAERDAKNVALQAEQQARADADAASERAVSALQTLTDETVNRLMASQPNLTSQNREFIDGIVAQLEQFTVTTKSSVRARVVQADGLNQIANLKARLGDDAGAVAMYRQSIEMWDRLCDEVKDKPEYRRGRADAFCNLGISLARMKQFVESEKAHRRAIEEHELLAREFPANDFYRKNVANCRNSFGVMLKDVKRNVETMEQYELAIAIYKNILAEHPEDQTAALRIGDVQNNYGLELFLAGKTDESIATFRDLIAFREKVVDSEQATPDDRSRLALTYLNLAGILYQAKRADEYLSSLEKAEQISISVVDEYPGVARYREWHINLLTMLSAAYSDQKRHDQRIAAETRKLPLIQQLVREFPGRTDFMEGLAQCHNVLAASWFRTDDPKQAEEHFKLAQTSFRAVLDRDPTNVEAHFQLSNSHLALAILLRKRQDIAQAVAELRQALKLCGSRPQESRREAKYAELMETAQKQLDECLSLLEKD